MLIFLWKYFGLKVCFISCTFDKDYSSFFVSVINKAYKALEDETTRQKCMDVVEEAKFKVDSAVRGHGVPFAGNLVRLPRENE